MDKLRAASFCSDINSSEIHHQIGRVSSKCSKRTIQIVPSDFENIFIPFKLHACTYSAANNMSVERAAENKSLTKKEFSGSTTTIRKSKYVSKKTLAQGMFDVALLSSNSSQLVQLFETNRRNELADDKYVAPPFFIFAVVLLSISITIQVIVGVCLLAVGILENDSKCDESDDDRNKEMLERKRKQSKRLNNITTILIFLITVISVIIPSFTSGLLPSDKAK